MWKPFCSFEMKQFTSHMHYSSKYKQQKYTIRINYRLHTIIWLRQYTNILSFHTKLRVTVVKGNIKRAVRPNFCNNGIVPYFSSLVQGLYTATYFDFRFWIGSTSISWKRHSQRNHSHQRQYPQYHLHGRQPRHPCKMYQPLLHEPPPLLPIVMAS